MAGRLADTPESIRHRCSADGCFLTKHAVNWGVLADCFGRGIRPSDIDGVVEMDGCFLWMEYKGHGATTSRAFDGLVKALVKQNATLQRCAHVFVVIEERRAPLLSRIVRSSRSPGATIIIHTGGPTHILETEDTEDTLRRICLEWDTWVAHGATGYPWAIL